MKQTAIILLLVLASIAGCEHASAPQPQNPLDRWKAVGAESYSIDQQRVCFCLEGGSIMRLDVRGGNVVRVLRLSDSTDVLPPMSNYYLSVDSLFGVIRARQYDSIVVRYNATFGYPEFMDVDPQLHPVDGGVLYETTNFRITR
jgi:hypothetical protein